MISATCKLCVGPPPVVARSAHCAFACTNESALAIHLSSPKPGHTTGGSGRTAGRQGGGAGSSRTGCQQNCSPRRQESLAPPKASRTRRLNVPPEARTSEIPFTCRVQNPNIPWAVRVGAAHGGAAGRGGAGQNRTPTGRVAQKLTAPAAPQGIVDSCRERPFASTNKGNPI